jgi:F-type H+-transporting ATPase subunit delta
MSELTTIARPYAKAAFESAVENKVVEQWQQMLTFAAEVCKNATMKSYLTGSVAAETLANVVNTVCGDQLDQHGQNFIKILAENKRLAVLPNILTMFNALKAEFDKEIDVDLTSAVKLSAKQLKDVSASLEKRLQRKVKLNCNVDPALVAGMVIRAGDTVIDGSFRSKLNRLEDALQA